MENTMKKIADKKKKGWSFIDDGTGVVITSMPKKTKKALLKARLEEEWDKKKKKK